ATEFEQVTADGGRRDRGPCHRRAPTTATAAAARTGTPTGATGVSATATATATAAAPRSRRVLKRGARSARKAAGAAASSPSVRGSASKLPATAPKSVPVFQQT